MRVIEVVNVIKANNNGTKDCLSKPQNSSMETLDQVTFYQLIVETMMILIRI